MTDVAYLCDNCGSVHEVEAVRENLILDLCTAGSYELSGQPGMLDPRARFLRPRMFRGLAWTPLPLSFWSCVPFREIRFRDLDGVGDFLGMPDPAFGRGSS